MKTEYKENVLIKDYSVKFKEYGLITIPKGTKVNNRTASGCDDKYNFVCSFEWVNKNYNSIANILLHDLTYSGLNVPKEYLK